jgi:hypothetical protein
MLFLDGVYEVLSDGSCLRFQWVREPTSAQLTQLAHTIARQVGRLLEREGLLERDTEQLDFSDVLDEHAGLGATSLSGCADTSAVLQRRQRRLCGFELARRSEAGVPYSAFQKSDCS